ncbi:MAG: hypothetical protein IJM30_08450, partial [Thermoguttaceae bacterium]|nr:hypothetical protein [Thermoguttaceae bacterium]
MGKSVGEMARKFASRRVRRSSGGAFALAFVLLAVSTALAQPDLSKLRSEPTNSNEKPTFWLLDENGSWRVPLPNWTLDDVARAIDSQGEKTDSAPYAIQSVSARGVVDGDLAKLTIEIDVSVADGTVRVPLGLSEGVYVPTESEEASGEWRTAGFSYEGPGACSLDVDPETGEYVVVCRSFRPRARAEAPKEPVQVPPETPEAPSETPSDPAPEQQSEPPVETPSDPTPEPAEAPVETPVDPAPEPAEAPVETPADPAPEPAEAPVETPADPAPEPAEA